MTRSARSILLGLGLLALGAAPASGETISILTNLSDWMRSSEITPSPPSGTFWDGVSVLPDASTFTVAVEGGAGHVANVEGSQNLFSASDVRFYQTIFALPAFGELTADLQISVDNDAQIFLNGFELAHEGSLLGENFSGLPHHRVFVGADGSVTNGYEGGDVFDRVAKSFPSSNWVSGGENTLTVAVRNLSGGDTGGFSLGLLLELLGPPPVPDLVPRLRLGSDMTSLAAGLDAARGTGDSGLAALIAQLDATPDAELEAALATLSPARREAPGRSVLGMTRSYHRKLHRNVHAGLPTLHGGALREGRHATLGEALRGELPSVSAAAAEGWHAFFEGFGGYGTEDADAMRVGARWWSTGALAGLDYAVAPDFVLGLSAGYGYTDASERSGAGSGNVHTGRLGPYLGFARGPWILDAGLSLGYHAIDDRRRVAGGNVRSDHGAWDAAFHGSFRFVVERGDFRFGPVSELHFVHVEEDGYTETGAAGALRIGSRDTDSLRSTVGGHVSWKAPAGERDLRIEGELGWVHEYLDDADTVAARFAAEPASGFRIRLPEADRDAVRASLGVNLALRERLRVQLGWDGTRSADVEDHSASLRVEARF